jgi:hypothetical protein
MQQQDPRQQELEQQIDSIRATFQVRKVQSGPVLFKGYDDASSGIGPTARARECKV